MRTFLTAAISIFISYSLFAQQAASEKFRDGKFKLIDDQGLEYIIVRNGSTQIEYDVTTKSKMELIVTWIDTCTYTLQFKKEISKTGKHVFPKDLVLTVKIVEMKEHSYVQRTTSNLHETMLEGEVFQIN